jgi:hypothetical protein
MRPEDDDAPRLWDIVTYARRLAMSRGRGYEDFLTRNFDLPRNDVSKLLVKQREMCPITCG